MTKKEVLKKLMKRVNALTLLIQKISFEINALADDIYDASREEEK